MFVERLATALSNEGLDVWVDTAGLFVGDEFWDRICAEIDHSSAVVFVVSENFARSEFCRREAEHAAFRRKRMLPVVIDAVAARQLPEPIRVRHWLSFKEAGSFNQSLHALVTAVRQDHVWIREHTRLFVRAVEWDERHRSSSLLLRGRELDEAVAWLADGSEKEPPVHNLHVEFIEASRQEDSSARERAERQERLSRSRALTTQAELLRSTPGASTLMAALLAAHAFHDHPSPEAYAIVRRTLGFLPRCAPRLDHPYRVGAVCFSPDGRLLATAAGMTHQDEQGREWVVSARGPSLEDVDEYSSGMLRLRAELEGRNSDPFDAFVWNAATGRQLARLTHRGRVRAMTFLPDGSGIATACEDGEASIRSASDGQRLALFPHPGPTWFIAVSPDGSRLLTLADEDPAGLEELNARVWSLVDAREQLRVPLGGMDLSGLVMRRELTSFTACTQLEQLAVAFVDGSVKVLSLVDGAVVSTAKTQSLVYSMAFSPDRRHLALGEGSQARILDAADCRQLAVLPHVGAVELLRWSPGGDRLVTVSGSQAIGLASRIEVWALDGSREASFELTHVRDVTVAPDGSVVAAAGAGSAVCIWDLGGVEGLRGELHFESSVNTVVFSPDGSRIAVGSDDLSARVWDAHFGLHLVRLPLDEVFQLIELSPDGRYVAVAGSSGCRILDVAAGVWITQLQGVVDALYWSPDGSSVALATRRGVRLWRWASGDELKLDRAETWAVTFGADGRYLVTAGARVARGGAAGIARIWRTSDGRLVRKVKHSDAVAAVAAHPDGVTFATAAGPYFGHDIIISRAGRGRQIWAEIAEPANDLAFSADGKVLAVGFHELGLGLFSVETGRALTTLTRFREVRAVRFDPAGEFLAVGTRSYSDRGVEVPTTEVLRLDGRFQVGPDHESKAVLPDESLLRFVEGGVLATKVGSSTRIRDTGSWEVICSFDGVSSTAAISFRAGLMARLTLGSPTVHLEVSRWMPDDLASEFGHRLPRGLSSDEWREYMGSEPFRPLPQAWCSSAALRR